MSLKVKFIYILSLIGDIVFFMIYLGLLAFLTNRVLLVLDNRILVFNEYCAYVFLILYFISYYFIYPKLNNNLTISEKLFRLRIENYNQVSLVRVVLTNFTFWISLIVLIIYAVPYSFINVYALPIIGFLLVVYLLLYFIGLDFITLFGGKIKFEYALKNEVVESKEYDII